jgi:signal transduction histidine kinase
MVLYSKNTPNSVQSLLSGSIQFQEHLIMGLAAFIRSKEEAIVAEWEAFAQTYLPSAAHMDRSALRDHIIGLLRFIAQDLETSQTERERSEKAKGQGPKEGGANDSAAETHADLRFTGGFDTVEMISEFRALRASVIKLWRAEWSKSETVDILPDLLRFNEAIDQVMTESLSRFTDKVNRSGSLFVGTLVHDFRGPLVTVYNSAQALVVRGKLDDEQVKLVSQIETSTSRISRLVSSLIDAVRIRLDKGMPIAPAPMDMGTAVQEAAKEVQAAHPGRTILIETSGDLEGEWDRARIGQVLSNLIGNAVLHGLKTSAIAIAAKGAGQDVMLSVHNDGAIPADAVATVFDPLPRGEDENRIQSEKAKLDLGLFITKGIVTAHGGKITVTSSEEEGTAFTVHLPRKNSKP